MNANSLRIGNWVRLKRDFYTTKAGQPYQISNVGVDYLDHWQDMGASDSLKARDVEPIALTVEVLTKAGFETRGLHFYGYNMLISPNGEGWLYLSGPLHVNIFYLHHLQNLVHALTLMELEIEL